MTVFKQCIRVTSYSEIIGSRYKLITVTVTNVPIVLKSGGSVPHPTVAVSKRRHRPNAVQQTARSVQHSMGKVLSRLTRWASLELGNQHPSPPQVPPCSINLDYNIDGGEIVIATAKQRDGAAAKVRGLEKHSLAILTSPQHTINGICIWTQVEHENIMPLLGITTKFDQTVSMVTEWMARGNAHSYVQDVAVDPRPLVCQRRYQPCTMVMQLCSSWMLRGD